MHINFRMHTHSSHFMVDISFLGCNRKKKHRKKNQWTDHTSNRIHWKKHEWNTAVVLIHVKVLPLRLDGKWQSYSTRLDVQLTDIFLFLSSWDEIVCSGELLMMHFSNCHALESFFCGYNCYFFLQFLVPMRWFIDGLSGMLHLFECNWYIHCLYGFFSNCIMIVSILSLY